MSVVDKILYFITDNKKRLSSRATIVVLSIIMLLAIDNIIGFSEHYNKSRELDRLESISKLLKEDNLSNETKNKLIELEKETLGRKSIIDYSLEFFRNISWNNIEESESIIDNNLEGRNNFWFLISSSGFYMLVAILVVPIFLFLDRKTPILTLIATMLMFIIIMAFTSWFNYWLFGKIIPDKLFGSWTWNYVVNIVVQISMIFGYLAIDKYAKRQSE